MAKPKPPTPRSVSATLRAGGWHASTGGDGYTAKWAMDGSLAVRVDYEPDAATDRLQALANMASYMRRKGWMVVEEPGHTLYVTAI